MPTDEGVHDRWVCYGGSHIIKAWSSTHASEALSRGEAEYYGLVCGVGIGLGIQSLYRDFGLPLKL